MVIESKELEIPKSAENTYNYILHLPNIENLLPRDKISEFKATDTTFGFKIQGGFQVELELVEKTEFSKVTFKTTESNNLHFTLDILLDDLGASCKAKQVCTADINKFMRMMVEKPLSALFDYMVDRLLKVSSEG